MLAFLGGAVALDPRVKNQGQPSLGNGAGATFAVLDDHKTWLAPTAEASQRMAAVTELAPTKRRTENHHTQTNTHAGGNDFRTRSVFFGACPLLCWCFASLVLCGV